MKDPARSLARERAPGEWLLLSVLGDRDENGHAGIHSTGEGQKPFPLRSDGGWGPARTCITEGRCFRGGSPEHAGSALTAFTASLSLVLTVGLLTLCHKWADQGLRVTAGRQGGG